MAQGVLDQHQDSEGTNFGFGEFAGARYRGQNFTPAKPGKLGTIGFSRVKGSKGIRVYIDITDASHLPVNTPAGALYSFDISNANVFDNYHTYDLPVPLALSVGTEYCFYLAPWDVGGTNAYADDYADCRGINTTPGGKEITNTAGVWSTETLTFHFATYMIPPLLPPSRKILQAIKRAANY